MTYSKSGNFRENFIVANSDLRHICDDINSGLGHDLPILLNGRVITPFREGSIFTKLRISRKLKTLAKIFEFTVCEQQRRTPAFALMQSDQPLRCSGSYDVESF